MTFRVKSHTNRS